MLEKIKNNKLKFVVLCVSVLIFVVGIVMSFLGTGDTYAVTSEDYSCPLGGGTPVYAEIFDGVMGYYCSFSEVSIATDSYAVGASVKKDSDCKAYLNEAGYTQVTTDAGFYCTYVAIEVEKNCYQCNSNGNLLEYASSTPSTDTCPSGWHTYSADSTSCKSYVISYDLNGGSGSISTTYKAKGNSVTLTTVVPTKSGYTFLGWSTSSTATSATYSSGDTYNTDADVTLYAVWGNASCYQCNSNGNLLEYANSTPSTDTCPSGWHTYSADSASCKSYVISYDLNGGSGSISTTYKAKGNSVTLTTVVPTKSGYTFLGWSTSSTATSATYSAGGTYNTDADVTLYAVWKSNSSGSDTPSTPTTYTVSYNANGGEGAPSSQTKTKGENLILSSAIPTRNGYVFLGWSASDTAIKATYSAGGTYSIDSSITLYAVWQAVYTITYNANGGEGAPTSQTGSNLTISSTIPTKVGYTFTSWNTKADGSGTDYNSGSLYSGSSDVTLYAKWIANEYKISYTLNGGLVTGNPTTATYDEEVEIKNPTKTVTVIGNVNRTGAEVGMIVPVEQKFIGWTSSTINTSTAYYGEIAWTNGNVKVVDTVFRNLISVNNGTVTMVANWEPTSITLPTVIKENYVCIWNTKADGSGTSYDSGSQYMPTMDSVASINLYAICDEIDKVDEEIIDPPKTGDIFIVFAWIIGIAAIGYSVYYFRSRNFDI